MYFKKEVVASNPEEAFKKLKEIAVRADNHMSIKGVLACEFGRVKFSINSSTDSSESVVREFIDDEIKYEMCEDRVANYANQ